MNHRPVIIPVASGKGGVGKSFITANLAIALAERGKQVIVIDLDLGGCNLHSFLGLPNRFPGIGDFLQVDGLVLPDLLVPTGITNLMFLPGDGKIPLLANIPFVQKVKLMNEIRKLPADYIFLDLGAGASYNTLDFYGISQFGILVIKPEYTSLMNMLTFLKNYLFRSVFQALSDDECRDLVLDILNEKLAGHLNSYVTAHRQEVIAAVENWWDKYRVTLRDIEGERKKAVMALSEFTRELGYG